MIRTKLLVASVFAGVVVLAISCQIPHKVPHVDPVWEFNCDGRYPVLSLSENGEVLAVGIQVSQGSRGPAPPDGSYGGVIEAWDLSKRKRIAQLQIDHGVQSIEFLSGGEEVFVGASNLDADKSPGGSHGSVQVWNVFDKKMTARVDFSEDVYSATMSPDKSIICVAIDDKSSIQPQIWCGSTDALRKGEKKLLTLDGLDVPIRDAPAMAFSGNGLFLFGIDHRHKDRTTNDGLVSIWDLKTGERRVGIQNVGNFPPRVICVDDTNGFVAMLISGGIFVSDIDGIRYPYNLLTAEFSRYQLKKECIAFSPKGDFFAVGGGTNSLPYKGIVVVTKLPEWEVVGRVQLDIHGTEINSIVFTNDGKQLIAASIDGSVRVWAVADIIEKGG